MVTAMSTTEELLAEQIRLGDGTAYRAVKVPHEPEELERRLARLGWAIAVTRTSGPFYWGAGTRSG